MQSHLPVEFNGYLIFILALIAVSYALDMIADGLNTSQMSPELPEEFRGIYDAEKYGTAIRYQKDSFRFEAVTKTFWLIVGTAFILIGGFQMADLFARSFNFGEIGTGLIFIGSLSLLRTIVGMPFSIYDTFVLEQKYGFNRTTPKVFIADLFKGLLLSAVLGGPILAAVIWFFVKSGSSGWLYAWIAFSVIQLFLMFLAPAVIMPLFNKFDPLPEGELKEEIERFAQKQNFKLQGIFKMDSSRRSTKSNAFFTGFGKFRRLVLFDTLIEKHSRDELVAVLAHEIGHFKRKHIQKMIVLSIVTTGVMFFVLGLFLNNPELFAAFGMNHLSVYASLVFVAFLFSPVMRFLSVFTHLLSRKHEFEADQYAVETYGKSDELISALKKLSIDNMSNLTPHPLKVMLDYTHPPILQRIEALRALRSN
jgi:STE24 endopeptidase